jgi:hypothetical protein
MSEVEKEVQDLMERLDRIGSIEFEVSLSASTAVTVISQIQLALRHPGNNGPSAQHARGFARALQDLLAEQDPEIGRYLERGWHSVFDVPRQVAEDFPP